MLLNSVISYGKSLNVTWFSETLTLMGVGVADVVKALIHHVGIATVGV